MLLLIALAHAPLYASTGSLPDPDRIAERTLADTVVAGGTDLFVLSRSYPLFALLFGYGLVWQLRSARRGGADDRAARALLRRRGRWLLLFGLVMALLVTPIEILGAYGVAALLVAGVVVRGEQALARAIRVVAPVSAVLLVLAAWAMSQPADPDTAGTGSFGYDVEGLITRAIAWAFSVVINVVGYPIVLMVLVGAWAGHRRLLEDVDTHRPLLRRVALVGLPIGVLGGVPLMLVTTGALPATAFGPAHVTSVVTGLAGGAAYAALFGLLGARLRPDAAGVRPVRAAGQRSLTSYVVMEAGLAVALSTTFVGLSTTLGDAGTAGVAVLSWLLAVLLATALAAAGRQGPAEALLRRVVRRRAGQRSPA